MDIHEYQAKKILSDFGIRIPRGGIAYSPENAEYKAREIGGSKWVVKAQIHSGSRGKAGGIIICKDELEVARATDKLLGKNLVTNQTGPEGKIVNRVYIEEVTNIKKELYLGLVFDRASECIMVVASTAGGMSVEEISREKPETIIRSKIEVAVGMQEFQAREIAFGLEIDSKLISRMAEVIIGCYRAFRELDATMVEINPLAISKGDHIFALDCKMSFDNNALFRRNEVSELRDKSQENPSEVYAAFSEVITATTGNDALEGGSGNTNYTMYQGTTLGGTDTVTDQGGTDGMTIEYLNNANMEISLGTPDVITIREGTTYNAGNTIGTISFSNIENLYLQDSVGGVAEKLSVPLSGAGTNIAMAGTNSNDTITLAGVTYGNAVFWGQGGNDTLTGGAGGDQIYGGAGNDVIQGGAGEDQIVVGAGSDDIHFVSQANFGTSFTSMKHDTVYGFVSGTDELKFTGSGFTGVAANDTIAVAGTPAANNATNLVILGNAAWVTAGASVGGVAAGNAAQRFLYNSDYGRLYYDADGSGGTAAIMIAELLGTNNLAVSNLVVADIDVV